MLLGYGHFGDELWESSSWCIENHVSGKAVFKVLHLKSLGTRHRVIKALRKTVQSSVLSVSVGDLHSYPDLLFTYEPGREHARIHLVGATIPRT